MTIQESTLALLSSSLTNAGFRHGFSTRAGGVSEGPFATLNFGAGDDAAHVAENVRRFGAAVGFDPRTLRQVTQVHGARVVNAHTMPDEPAAREEADALTLAPAGTRPSASHARAVGIRVADCVPVLVAASSPRSSCQSSPTATKSRPFIALVTVIPIHGGRRLVLQRLILEPACARHAVPLLSTFGFSIALKT